MRLEGQLTKIFSSCRTLYSHGIKEGEEAAVKSKKLIILISRSISITSWGVEEGRLQEFIDIVLELEELNRNESSFVPLESE